MHAGRAIRNQGQTATEYMLIISVVVIAVVAAAYEFVPLFKAGVKDLGSDVKQMLSNGGSRGGGAGMGSGTSARVASRPCDGSAEALRYEAMFDPPPCAIPKPAEWTPSPEPAFRIQRSALRSLRNELTAPTHVSIPLHKEASSPPVCREDPVVYLSSARLGRRSRSRNR